jgi:cytoskeletal protein CcmA (bactofilin family)
VFRGTFECGEDAQIDGRFEGSIQSSAAVIVGVSGEVQGNISADSVTVAGRVEGSVIARQRLHMLSTGSIKGDATYGTLEVERGGVIEGRAVNASENGAAALLEDKPAEVKEVEEPRAAGVTLPGRRKHSVLRSTAAWDATPEDKGES